MFAGLMLGIHRPSSWDKDGEWLPELVQQLAAYISMAMGIVLKADKAFVLQAANNVVAVAEFQGENGGLRRASRDHLRSPAI